jgi:lysophospholipase L1-like esterase
MKRRVYIIPLVAALAGAAVAVTLLAYGLGAVVGKHRPELAKPFSDWALAMVLPALPLYCDVADVTTCGVSKSDSPAQSCDPFTSGNPRHAVLFAFGQSNSANYGQTRHTATDRVLNFNIHDGKCYSAVDPLLGADGDGGSVWGLVGDALVASGAFDRVLIVPFGIGSTGIGEWTAGGRLHPRVEFAARQLALAGIAPTHVLWHQGENDARAGTSGEEYTRMFEALVDALRGYGIDAPVFPAIATLCNDLGSDPLRDAQRALPGRVSGVFPGPDTDTLSDMRDRFDYCHFSQQGMESHARLWTDSILAFESKR